MLELTCYKKAELSKIFGTQNTEGLNRKLERYGIVFEKSGRGKSALYHIQKIKDPFKVYAIVELGFDGGIDFKKLRNFYWYYFNDDEFRTMPDEVKEYRMRKSNVPVSRQTIANYESHLVTHNLVMVDTKNCIYYFAYKQEQRFVEKEEYLEAWYQYWDDIDNGLTSFEAICNMRETYGGVARKQPIAELNGIYLKEIDYIMSLIQMSIENELDN